MSDVSLGDFSIGIVLGENESCEFLNSEKASLNTIFQKKLSHLLSTNSFSGAVFRTLAAVVDGMVVRGLVVHGHNDEADDDVEFEWASECR